jgi:hypothetical protein
LIEWAAEVLNASTNQPRLPHAIIVLNAADARTSPKEWDVDYATNSLLDSVILSGTYRINCVRLPETYAQWQHETYDAILAGYMKLQTDYTRRAAEAAVINATAVQGNNPGINELLVRAELKRACASFLTMQNFEQLGGAVSTQGSEGGIPQVTDFAAAYAQGRYAQFLEQAFEWENLQYALYPYFWARRETWRSRLKASLDVSAAGDPEFAAFVRAGAARVTLPARLGFGAEVLYFLQTGITWGQGPLLDLITPEYRALLDEIRDAEADPAVETKVGKPWLTEVPTDLVRLRPGPVMPQWELDETEDIYVEVDPDGLGLGRER